MRLREARKKAGLTQSQLAIKIGIGQNTYSYWETGKTKIDSVSLAKLAEILGVSIDYILGHDIHETEKREREESIHQKEVLSLFEISPHEINLIKKYRALDERGRQAVDDTIDREYEFVKPKVEESAIS